MAFLRYAKASVVQAAVSGRGWGKVRTAAAAPSRNIMAQAAEILGAQLDPDKFLLTHSTIVASVDVDPVPGVKLGKVKVGSRTVNRKYSDYYIKPECSNLVNNNGDSWSRDVLMASYPTFIGGHNFCFAPGTGILLADGTYKPIEDVDVGDRVITHTGATRPVTHKFERDYEGDIHAVRLDRFKEPLFVTGNHPFRVLDVSADPIRPRRKTQRANTVRYWKDQVAKALRGDRHSLKGFKAGKVWGRADQMTPGSYVLGPERKVGDISNPALAEILGYYLSEGCPLSPTTDQGFVLSFGPHERQLAERAVQVANEAFSPTSVTVASVQTGIQVRVYSAEVSRRIVALGGHLASKKRLAEEVFGWDRESLLRLLAAWMAGDGNLHKGTLRLRGSTASKSLADQMQRVAELCGVKSSVVFERQNIGEVQSRVILTVGGEPRTFDVIPRHHSWTVLVSKESTAEIATRSVRWGTPLHDASKSRKRAEFAWWGNTRAHRVASNETLPYAGKVYNIEVEEDHSYVVDYGVAVHNCEHVQIEEQSKGRIIDAVARDIGHSVYIDILVATARKHTQLIKDIASGKMATLSMGCFPAGTMVTMADGTRVPIEDVQPGDMVLTHKGRAREVLNKQIRGIENGHWDTRTVHAVGLSSPITATDNHPFYVLRPAEVCACGCGEALLDYAPPRGGLKHKYTTRKMTRRFKRGHDKRILNPNGSYSLDEYRERHDRLEDIQRPKLVKVRADELRVGDFIAFPRVKDGEYTVEVSEGRARLLGYFLAEGSFNKRKGRRTTVVFSFSLEEKGSYVAEVCRLLEQEFPGKNKPWVQDRPERNTCVVHLTSREAAEWFYRHGGEYSHGKRLSPEVMNWSMGSHQHLIGTWINGDGTCAKAHNGFLSGTTVSLNMANQLHALMAKCGWFARFEARIGSRSVTVAEAVNGGVAVRDEATGRLPSYTLVLSNTQSVELQGYSDKAPTTSQYDNQNYRTLHDWTVAPITEIKTGTYGGWVHDMEVDEDHTYVVEGAIVSNCSVEETICTKCGNVAIDETDLCFPPETRVLLADGMYRPIKEVVPGDLVVTHTGAVEPVLHTMSREYDGHLTVLNIDGVPNPLRSTPNHPYWVLRPAQTCACGCGEPLDRTVEHERGSVNAFRRRFRRGHNTRLRNPNPHADNVVPLDDYARVFDVDFEFVRADEIRPGDYTAYPIPKGVEDTPDATEAKARLIGYFLAEGCFIKRDGRRVGVAFSFGFHEYETLAVEVVDLLNAEFGRGERRESSGGWEALVSDQDISPIRRRSNSRPVPQDVECPSCGAPSDYAYNGRFKPGRDDCYTCKVCGRNWVAGADRSVRAHRYPLNGPPSEGDTRIQFLSEDAAEFFFHYCGEYAEGKVLPADVMRWDPEVQRHLLMTWLGGDGTQNTTGIRGNSASFHLVCQMHMLAARCDLYSYRNVVFGGKVVTLDQVVNGDGTVTVRDDRGWRPTFSLTISEPVGFDGEVRFTDRETARVTMRSLCDGFKRVGDWLLYRIRDVWSETYSGKVYNFEVEGDHSYVVDGVAVHNCPCIRYEKLNKFFDAAGQQRVIAELCGHTDIADNAGVHFIEASWVATPAFEGAVLRNILDIEHMDAKTIRSIQAALNQLPPQWDGTHRVKAAAFRAGFDFGDENADEFSNEPAEGEESTNPLDEAVDEVAKAVRDRAVEKVREDLDGNDVDEALNPTKSTMSPNDSIIKEGYVAAVKALTKKASSDVEFIDGLASMNRVFGVQVPRSTYRAALKVGSTDSYTSMSRFLAACHHAAGRQCSPAEIRVMARIGKLLSRLGGNPTPIGGQ